MKQNQMYNELKIIEVPPELRGLSDEEIIKNSEKKEKEFKGKRKNGSSRPSKRERLANKQFKEKVEAENIVAEIFGIPKPPKKEVTSTLFKGRTQDISAKRQMVEKVFTDKSPSLSRYSEYAPPPQLPKKHTGPLKSIISEAPRPASGKVLRATFGGLKGATTVSKAVVVTSDELAKQKAEERAKKLKDLYKKQNPAATTMPNGEPIKRGRGRPRKNPLPPPAEGV